MSVSTGDLGTRWNQWAFFLQQASFGRNEQEKWFFSPFRPFKTPSRERLVPFSTAGTVKPTVYWLFTIDHVDPVFSSTWAVSRLSSENHLIWSSGANEMGSSEQRVMRKLNYLPFNLRIEAVSNDLWTGSKFTSNQWRHSSFPWSKPFSDWTNHSLLQIEPILTL